MKLKSLSFFPILLVFITLSICSIESFGQVKKSVNRPAKEPYASMSASDKKKVQEKLIAQLRVDRDFIAMRKISTDMLDYSIAMRAKGIKFNPKDKNDATPEAKKMREYMLDIMIKNMTLIRNYPELEQLDSETRKTVMRTAIAKKAV